MLKSALTMEFLNELKSVLNEVCNYLENEITKRVKTEDTDLSKARNLLTTVRTMENYVQDKLTMDTGGYLEMNLHKHDTYVEADAKPTVQEVDYSTADYVSSANNDNSVNENPQCPHLNTFLKDLPPIAKDGILYRKEQAFRVFTMKRTFHVVLIDEWILFYLQNKSGTALESYHADSVSAKSNDDDTDFTLDTRGKLLMMCARTYKEKTQWVAAINGLSNKTKKLDMTPQIIIDERVSEPSPTKRELPKIPVPEYINTDSLQDRDQLALPPGLASLSPSESLPTLPPPRAADSSTQHFPRETTAHLPGSGQSFPRGIPVLPILPSPRPSNQNAQTGTRGTPAILSPPLAQTCPKETNVQLPRESKDGETIPIGTLPKVPPPRPTNPNLQTNEHQSGNSIISPVQPDPEEIYVFLPGKHLDGPEENYQFLSDLSTEQEEIYQLVSPPTTPLRSVKPRSTPPPTPRRNDNTQMDTLPQIVLDEVDEETYADIDNQDEPIYESVEATLPERPYILSSPATPRRVPSPLLSKPAPPPVPQQPLSNEPKLKQRRNNSNIEDEIANPPTATISHFSKNRAKKSLSFGRKK